MCFLCELKSSSTPSSGADSDHRWHPRRGFLMAAGSVVAGTALAQVNVGEASMFRGFASAEQMDSDAKQAYAQELAKAQSQNALARNDNPQLLRLHGIARRLIPFTSQWNPRASNWRWEVNLIGNKQINAWCMPGGKIAFYTGILDRLQLTDDEIAMVMGHEMAHALREHARERMGKTKVTGIGLSVASALLGLGQLGDVAANFGTQFLSLKFSRDDETEADLVGLEIAARAGYRPEASVQLWKKMVANNSNGGLSWLSTHPSGGNRIQELEANLPKVQHLYLEAKRG